MALVMGLLVSRYLAVGIGTEAAELAHKFLACLMTFVMSFEAVQVASGVFTSKALKNPSSKGCKIFNS